MQHIMSELRAILFLRVSLPPRCRAEQLSHLLVCSGFWKFCLRHSECLNCLNGRMNIWINVSFILKMFEDVKTEGQMQHVEYMWIAVGRCGCDAADVLQAQAGDNMFLAKKKRPSQSMPGFLRLNDEPVWLLSMALRSLGFSKVEKAENCWKTITSQMAQDSDWDLLRLHQFLDLCLLSGVVICRLVIVKFISCWCCQNLSSPRETVKKHMLWWHVVKCSEMLKKMWWKNTCCQSRCQSLLVSSCWIRGMAGAIHRSLQGRTDLLQERPLPPSISRWNPLESLGNRWINIESIQHLWTFMNHLWIIYGPIRNTPSFPDEKSGNVETITCSAPVPPCWFLRAQAQACWDGHVRSRTHETQPISTDLNG